MADFVAREARQTPALSNYSLGALQREPATAPPIVDDVLRSSGEPLEADTRRFFEGRFRHDFGAVRVHRDARAAESARAVYAQAYTVGHDIVFDSGRFAPQTETGRRLLAHELAHVVQQNARASAMHRAVPPAASLAPVSLQRQGGGGSSAITNVSVTPGPKPNVVRQVAGTNPMVQVTFDKNITAIGSAQVSGPDAGKYEFGFLQICRPFDVMRATYHESGAPAGPGKDLNRDGTNAIRKVQPALDGNTDWFGGKSAKGPSARVVFDDRPDSPFEKSVMKNTISYDISGVAAASSFFTAFAAKGPDGKFQPLKTFYWGFNHCEPLPPGTDFSKPKVGASVTLSPIATCPGCSETEPGFNKINDPRGPDTCVSLVSGAWGSVMFDGPGTFSFNC